MRNKKIWLSILIILCFVFTGGAVFKSVTIMTQNGEPLINLDELIHSTDIGQEGSSDKGEIVDNTPSEDDKEPQDSSGSSHNPESVIEPEPEDGHITVEVYDTQIRYDGKIYYYDRKLGCDEFEAALTEIGDKQVVLQDNYAEAHAYKYVLGYLKTLVTEESRLLLDPNYDKSWGVISR